MKNSGSFQKISMLALMLLMLAAKPVAGEETNTAPLPLIAPACLMPGMLGTATIDDHNVITLTYRGPHPQQTGYAQLVYRPGTPDYDAVATHIGNIKPGELKQIAPWTARAPS